MASDSSIPLDWTDQATLERHLLDFHGYTPYEIREIGRSRTGPSLRDSHDAHHYYRRSWASHTSADHDPVPPYVFGAPSRLHAEQAMTFRDLRDEQFAAGGAKS